MGICWDDDDDTGDDDDDDDGNDDDDGLPAYSHQSYSHQVGICHNDEGWEYDTVNFPPYLYIMTLGDWNATSHIPTRWESVIMMKGGNMTQSNSHHTHR